MKTILMTAYDIDPYKGSESGMGWNFAYQASKYGKIEVITRKNNRKNIEKYIEDNNVNINGAIFHYFDLPRYLRFWKRGSRGSSLYFYLWQMFIPIFIRRSGISFDIAHNLNFHADAFPTFLWVFGKALIWGPINHHEKIDARFITSQYGIKELVKDRLTWMVKLLLWNLDPFSKMAKYKALKILGGNTSVQRRLNISDDKFILYSSVGSEEVEVSDSRDVKVFRIITVGRFVPLKGFDVAINSFIHFLENNSQADNVLLTIIGKGPEEEYLKKLAGKAGGKIEFIDWVERGDLIRHYSKSSMFLFPSHEGAGMVVMEAMSYGLPVVCFDNYGPGELVDENSGIRIPYSSYEESIAGFSLAIKRIYEDKYLRNKLSVGARERFSQKYSWNAKGVALGEIYEKV